MGNPFVHFELNTSDVEKAKKFYGKIFDWDIQPMPTMNYTGIKAGSTGGGITANPMPGAPSHWLTYVEVDSVKATLAKAKKAGANVVVDFMPIGEMGAIGVFLDPQGAALGVWEKSKAGPPPAAEKAAPKKAAAKKAAPKKAPAAAAKASAPAKKASVPPAAPKKAAKKR